MVITTHVCRGNYHSDWAFKGPYDAVSKTLFALEQVDAFYLEFDDERSGGFAPLADVADGKQVVLGLITTKRPELEDKATVIRRIHEAAQYIPLDRLCLSPQCGFASCEIGNKLTEEQQWAKIAWCKKSPAKCGDNPTGPRETKPTTSNPADDHRSSAGFFVVMGEKCARCGVGTVG